MNKLFTILSIMFLSYQSFGVKTYVPAKTLTNLKSKDITINNDNITLSPTDTLVYTVTTPVLVPTTGNNTSVDTAKAFVRISYVNQGNGLDGQLTFTTIYGTYASITTNGSGFAWTSGGGTRQDSIIMLENITQEVLLINTGTEDVQVNEITFLKNARVSIISNTENELFGTGETSVRVGPSPATDLLTIALPSTIASMNLKICSLDGAIQKRFTVEGAFSVDVSDLNTGIYLLIDEETGNYKKIMVN